MAGFDKLWPECRARIAPDGTALVIEAGSPILNEGPHVSLSKDQRSLFVILTHGMHADTEHPAGMMFAGVYKMRSGGGGGFKGTTGHHQNAIGTDSNRSRTWRRRKLEC
jgi:hypothetical protein